MLHKRCPALPGVYGWLDRNRRLLYVGKSKSLRYRLLSYFAKTPTDDKMLRIRQHGRTLVWETVANELLALIREQELIHRWQPDMNRQGQPIRMQPAFLCISKTVAPRALLARRPTPGLGQCFGPIQGTGRLREAIESLNYVFQLRDCPDKTGFHFNNQLTLFDIPAGAQCIRHELGTCLAPCAGLCSRSGYQSGVTDATDFLTGDNRQILDRLKREMIAAAAEQSYERAATLRDHVNRLAWLDRRLNDLRNAQRMLDGVLPVPPQNPQQRRPVWLILRHGRLVESIETDSPTQPLATRIQAIAREPASMPVDLLDTRVRLLLAGWLKNNSSLAADVLTFGQAIEAISQPDRRQVA